MSSDLSCHSLAYTACQRVCWPQVCCFSATSASCAAGCAEAKPTDPHHRYCFTFMHTLILLTLLGLHTCARVRQTGGVCTAGRLKPAKSSLWWPSTLCTLQWGGEGGYHLGAGFVSGPRQVYVDQLTKQNNQSINPSINQSVHPEQSSNVLMTRELNCIGPN